MLHLTRVIESEPGTAITILGVFESLLTDDVLNLLTAIPNLTSRRKTVFENMNQDS
jgi:hypothetical protein